METNNLKIIIQNELDERTFNWLKAKVGEDKINWAIGQLSGKTRPYMSNIVKKLGLTVPSDVKKTPTSKARHNLKELINIIDACNKS
jgi:hypothetical protein